MTKRTQPASASIRWCTALLAAAVGAPLAQAATIEVPGDAASLSAAIALAQDGDTILVGDGTWKGPNNRNLVISGKDLVLRSAHGPTKCNIDCEKLGRFLTLTNCGPAATVVQGFSIAHGLVTSGTTGGQGISVSGGAPVLRDCTITACGFTYDGDQFGPSGGGLYLSSSNALVENCRFLANEAEDGGGLFAVLGSPVVRRCVFRDNSAQAHIEEGIPVGGFWEGEGGGVDLSATVEAVIADCVFDHNQSVVKSGALGIRKTTSDPCTGRVSHCSFVRNHVMAGTFGQTSPGEVIWVTSFGPGLQWNMDHCIVWANDNVQPSVKAPANGFTVSWCDIDGGYAGTGNLHVDPGFVDLGAGNLRLAAGSPCVDVGPPEVLPFGGALDIDRASRLLDGDLDGELALDMGAYERTNVEFHVTGVADPGGTLTLHFAGKAGLSCVALVGTPITSDPTLVAKLGYALADLGTPWSIVAGPVTIPAQATLGVPAGLAPGTIFVLQPLAWASNRHAGNFGVPQWVVVN